MRCAAALLLVGCGGGLGERAREAALAPPLGAELADACGEAPIAVVERTQEDLWEGRGRRGRLAEPPDGSVVNEETGELLALPPPSGRYFTASCDLGCMPLTVLVHCADQCVVVGDNLVDRGTIDCPTY